MKKTLRIIALDGSILAEFHNAQAGFDNGVLIVTRDRSVIAEFMSNVVAGWRAE